MAHNTQITPVGADMHRGYTPVVVLNGDPFLSSR
jgi:hypothetical protein